MALSVVFNPFTSNFDYVDQITLAAVGSSPNANGASASSNVLTLQPADGTHPGLITSGSQTIGGAKTFSSSISASNLSGTNSGDVTLSAVGSSSNINGATLTGQILALQPATASFPGALLAADWVTFNSKQAAISAGALDAQSGSANGFSFTGNVISMQSASASFAGLVTNGTQTLAGAKTFSTSASALFFSSTAINPASAGVLRVSNTQALNWRNAGNSADLGLSLDGSNIFQFTSAVNSSGNVTGANLSGNNTGDITLAAVGASSNANAASLSGQVLTIQPASASFPGVLTAGTQSLGGDKTLTGNITATNLSGTNTGDITLAAVGSAPSANGATLSGQVLTLQPADATRPGVVTTAAQTFAGQKNFNGNVGILDSSAAFNVILAATSSTTLTADRTLTIDMVNAARTFKLAGNLTVSAAATVSNTNTGDITLTAFGSTPNANGASLSAQALNLQPADGTNPGGVSTTTQTLAGAKTFSTSIATPSFKLNGSSSGTITMNSGTTPANYTLVWPAAQASGTKVLQNDGSGNLSWATGSGSSTAPTVQKFTSGSGTYTTPTSPSPLYIRIIMVGAGGGGGGSGTGSGGTGGTGGNTTFGSNTAAGGVGGVGTSATAAGGAGGTATLSGSSGMALTGASGGSGVQGVSATTYACSGNGGNSALGGGGMSIASNAGNPGVTNTGGGGGGGGSTANSTSISGAGGGAGGYINAIITSPSATYSYAVGAAGTAGTAGTGGGAGGAGGSGIIVIEEYYQ